MESLSRQNILIIDDEAQIRKLLEITLATNNFHPLLASTGKEGLAMAATHNPDLIILDLGLPDIDGQDLLVLLREWYTHGILVLSVRNSEQDIIKALDHGANDYLTKPFRTGELLARVRTSLRHAQNIQQNSSLTFGKLLIDLTNRTVLLHNEPVKMTSTEYSLLILLAKNDGKVLTHQYLLKEIWGPGYIEQSQYLRVFIGQLRKKIEENPNDPKYIQTESGIGYRFCTKLSD